MKRIAPPAKVLDVGCGCGYHDILLAQSHGVRQVVGIDYSAQSIHQAERHYPHSNVIRVVADIFDWQNIRAIYGPFDLVVAFQVIEHLRNPVEFLRCCVALAGERGNLAVVTPNKDCLQNRFRRACGRKDLLIDPMHFAEYNISEIRQFGEGGLGLDLAGVFSHTLSFSIRGHVIIDGCGAWGFHSGKWRRDWANVIGMVWRRP